MDIFQHMQTNYFKDMPATEANTDPSDSATVNKLGFRCIKSKVDNAFKVFFGKLKTFFFRNHDKKEETEAQELFGFGKKEEDKATKYAKDPNSTTPEIVEWLDTHRDEIIKNLAADEFLVEPGDELLTRINCGFAMDIKQRMWEQGSNLIALQFNINKGTKKAILGLIKADIRKAISKTLSFGYLTVIYKGVDPKVAVETNDWPKDISVTLIYHPLWDIEDPGVIGAKNRVVVVGYCDYSR